MDNMSSENKFMTKNLHDNGMHYSRKIFINALIYASDLLKQHKEDVNKLNVFPVPDGDTGTNMSLTLESVVEHVKKIGPNPSISDIRRAVTTGALMGARGNSGVITSQILRGFCEGFAKHELLDAKGLALAFSRAEEVAFAAVRKPIEGTILTVLRDSTKAAKYAYKKKMDVCDAITYVSEKAYKSVENTPNLLSVLKENNVVDAGGYGFAIFVEGISSALTGVSGILSEELDNEYVYNPKVEIEQINDWAGSKYTYCNEFLVDSVELNIDDALEFLASVGDCELCVGSCPKYKVHVHSDNPDKVLSYFIKKGQIFEVFIHNMKIQSEDRIDKLNDDSAMKENLSDAKITKEIGIVAVASGEGNTKILKDLGVDIVVCGGQTMNPSTKDLVEAAKKTNAKKVIFLPNNKNIILSAKAAGEVLDIESYVIQTKNIPSALYALMSFDTEENFDNNIKAMKESFEDIDVAEITFAIKDSKDYKDRPIKKGDCIGIVNGEIVVCDSKIDDVFFKLLEHLEAKEKDMLTIIAGSDIKEKNFNKLLKQVENKYEDLEIDSRIGNQPLYPIIFSLE